jgi:hypothetical protein
MKRKASLFTTLGMMGALALTSGCGRTQEYEAQTFQGYRYAGDGQYFCVFDSENASDRKGVADFELVSDTASGLRIGADYNIEVKKSPLFGSSLVSYQETN